MAHSCKRAFAASRFFLFQKGRPTRAASWRRCPTTWFWWPTRAVSLSDLGFTVRPCVVTVRPWWFCCRHHQGSVRDDRDWNRMNHEIARLLSSSICCIRSRACSWVGRSGCNHGFSAEGGGHGFQLARSRALYCRRHGLNAKAKGQSRSHSFRASVSRRTLAVARALVVDVGWQGAHGVWMDARTFMAMGETKVLSWEKVATC